MNYSIEISNWPDDQNEFIFPSYTSLINSDVVHAALKVKTNEENIDIKAAEEIDPTVLSNDLLSSDSNTTQT